MYTVQEANSQNYIASPIQILSSSGPDVAPNLFDVYICDFNTTPTDIMNREKVLPGVDMYSNWFLTEPQLLFRPKTTDASQFSESSDTFISKTQTLTNKVISTRVTSIDFPISQTKTRDIKFLKRTIPSIINQSDRQCLSTMTIRLDQNLKIYDYVNMMSGNFPMADMFYDTGTEDKIHASLHSTFFPSGKYVLADGSRLDGDNVGKINIYVIRPDHYVFIFEDVRFTGTPDIQYTQSAGPLSADFEFIYRRTYIIRKEAIQNASNR